MKKQLTFTKKSIKDQDLLKRLVDEEATRIYNNPSLRRGRTKDQLRQNVEEGKVAEMFICQVHPNIRLSGDIYHDLENTETGDRYEVKAYYHANRDNQYLRDSLRSIRGGTWNDSIYLFMFENRLGTYRFVEKITI